MRNWPSSARVIAALTLLIAFGGADRATAGKKNSVGTKQIKDGAVTDPKLATGAVTDSKLAPGAVTGAAIADGAVTGSALAAGAVSGAALADGSVGSAAIAPGAVTATQMGPDSVSGGNIVDGTVTAADLAPDQAPQTPSLTDCAPGTPWVGVPNLTPHYWMDKARIVHLEGAVSCSVTATNGGRIFQMPYNFRPVQDVVRFATIAAGLSLAQVAVIKEPSNAGLVYDGATNGTASDDYVSLDGITYRGEGPLP